MAFEYACKLDVFSVKPGNVFHGHPAYGMTHKDFLQSSMACSDVICEQNMDIGEKILECIKSSIDVVGCNTNLGIILLCVPIVEALYMDKDHKFLQSNLKKVINGINETQTKNIYKAINIAKAGGMGSKDKFDLNNNKSKNFTLLEAMEFASSYDYIAGEYSNNFNNIINTISVNWRNYFKLMGNGESATTATFLKLISSNPDSLIARKHGLDKAKEVSERFKTIADEYCVLKNPNNLNNQLLLLDSELKIQGLNPGTTADVVVASIFLNRLGL
ncbi:triphosphoribosyl-dephospho-CoA synthase [Gammaproteobacteria bacterium]|nr:triphosphoribosyl-dephospho-CoA synthase [Gammaproteobacteria bacterium]